MGYSQGSRYIDWKDGPNGPTGAKFKVIPFSVEDEFHDDEHETRKIFKRNMIWELGLGCFLPIRRRGSRLKDKKQGGKDNGDSDNDEAWLLVESGSLGPHFMSAVDPKSLAADPQSVHSSFRFSFGSQMDLEALNGSSSVSAATVLMVNLSTDLSDSQSHDMKWRRFQSLERSISPVASTLERFSYSEIRAATGNFSKDRVLGRGALSCVFKGRVGFLRKAVAIKRLVKEDKESTKAFCRELMIASSLHNRNVVLLMGFCIDPEEGLFLVYKFVSGGSLQHYLHANRGVKGGSLPWSVRFKVAVGIAEAIAYLHNGSEKCVVHRDIKPSNILLSSKKKPKLCDFGLATWTPAPSVPFLCKTVKGTFGYLAPEYFQHGKVSDKTDVYAFGVVLLELITGRKPIEANRRSGDDNLVLWAKALLQRGGSIKELLDPTLTISPRDSNQLMKMIQAAAACIESEESRRPSINQIVAILQGDENYSSSSNISAPSRNDSIIDNYSHLQHKKSEMRSHFALAMLGVSDYEEDNHLYCR